MARGESLFFLHADTRLPEDADRVFERYERGDDTVGGVGLGLPIAREIAQGHGGDLVLEPAAEGALKVGRKGVSMYTLVVSGRSAHAGLVRSRKNWRKLTRASIATLQTATPARLTRRAKTPLARIRERTLVRP